MTAPARDPAPLDLRRQLGIETPENVQLRFELAGVGSRVAAATMDLLVIFLGFLLLAVGFAVVGSGASDSGGSTTATAWITAILYLITSFAILLYFTLFEALAGGRTPGKRALGIRVVMDTGRPLSSGAAVIRNLLRLVDMFFPLAPFLPACSSFFSPRAGSAWETWRPARSWFAIDPRNGGSGRWGRRPSRPPWRSWGRRS